MGGSHLTPLLHFTHHRMHGRALMGTAMDGLSEMPAELLKVEREIPGVDLFRWEG